MKQTQLNDITKELLITFSEYRNLKASGKKKKLEVLILCEFEHNKFLLIY